MPHMTDKNSCPMRGCNKCDFNRQDLEEYKRKYEIAKSGLTKEERDVLIELICNEQTIHMVAKGEFDTDKYILLEQLKAKIRTV